MAYYGKRKKNNPLAWAIVCTIIGIGYTTMAIVAELEETAIIGTVFILLAVVYWVVFFVQRAEKKKKNNRC